MTISFEDFIAFASDHCDVDFSCPQCGHWHRQEDGPFPSPDEVCPKCGGVMDYEVL